MLYTVYLLLLCSCDECTYVLPITAHLWPGAKMRPGGGRGKSSQNAGGRGRNRGGSRARGDVGGEMNNYHRNGKLSLDDISTC